jgi:phosphate uptake regulator
MLMKRKAIKQGTGSLTMSLPNKWVKKNNITAGTDLQVEEQEKTLIISPEKIKVSKTFEMNASTKKLMTNRTIQSAYNQGFDEIKIDYDDPRMLSKIKKVADELIGFELIEETNKFCILKELTGIQQMEFDSIFRRLFRIINGMAEEGLTAITEKDKAGLDNVIIRDLEVNKFSNLCIRYLNRLGHPIFERTSAYVIICYNLEVIADGYKELFAYARDSKKDIKQYIPLMQKINQLFKECFEFTFKPTDQKANQIAEQYEQLKKETENTKYKDDKIMNALKKILNFTITLQGLQMTYSK